MDFTDNNPHAEQKVPTSEQSELPKPLTLADIRVGERYVTLQPACNGWLHAQSWKAVAEPVLYAGPWVGLQGKTVMNVEITFSDGAIFADEIFASDYGLVLPDLYDNGHRTFLAAPEIVALIADIVEQQDHAGYVSLTRRSVPSPRNRDPSSAWILESEESHLPTFDGPLQRNLFRRLAKRSI